MPLGIEGCGRNHTWVSNSSQRITNGPGVGGRAFSLLPRTFWPPPLCSLTCGQYRSPETEHRGNSTYCILLESCKAPNSMFVWSQSKLWEQAITFCSFLPNKHRAHLFRKTSKHTLILLLGCSGVYWCAMGPGGDNGGHIFLLATSQLEASGRRWHSWSLREGPEQT